MKVSKKSAACICALMMATSSFAVFSVNAADAEGAAASASQTVTEETASENVKVGKVTEINGSQAIVALGEFSGKRSRTRSAEGEEGTGTAEKTGHSGKMKIRSSDAQTDSEEQHSKKVRKERSADSAAAGSGETQSAEEKISGRKHGDKGIRHDKFTENGTTETVTVTDDVVVTKKGETVTASDISVGDIVKLKYDENDYLTEVKVFAKHKHGRKAAEKTAEESSVETEQTANA